MTQERPLNPIAQKRLVHSVPGMEAVLVRREQADGHAGEDSVEIDVYYPPTTESGRDCPAVLFVTGFPDAGAQRMLGCRLKEMGAYVSWAQLVAASGLVAITYANTNPTADANAVLQHVRQHAVALGINAHCLALWACSGNVPNALSVLMRNPEDLRCAVLCYGYLLDLDGSGHVSQAARTAGFVNPTEGFSVDDLPQNVPLLLVRAGRDQMPGLNETLDRFFAKALASDLPVTCMNHAHAPHAFDLFDDRQTSREVIRHIIDFLRVRLVL